MPQTPQDFGGPLYEDELRMRDQYGVMPFGPGGVLYSDGYFYAEDQYGSFNLRHPEGGTPSADEKVKISPNDTTSNYLFNKLLSGPNIIITEENNGLDEYMLIDAYGFTTGSIKYRYLIWAEENGAIANNQREWSFGNGATGNIGMPVWSDGYIVGMTYNAETAGDATTEVQVHVNGSSVTGGSIVPGNGANDAITTLSTPVAISAGDRIGFFTLFGGGASDVRVAAVIEHEAEVVGLRGEKGDQGASGVDEFVKVSSNDTTASYLSNKVVSGDNISITELNDGGNETLQISASLDDAYHRSLDQLVHLIAEPSFEEYTYSGNKVTNIVVYETAAKLKKIREEAFTYTSNRVTTIITKQYDAAGTLIVGETMTETLSYSGGQVTDITRVLT